MSRSGDAAWFTSCYGCWCLCLHMFPPPLPSCFAVLPSLHSFESLTWPWHQPLLTMNHCQVFFVNRQFYCAANPGSSTCMSSSGCTPPPLTHACCRSKTSRYPVSRPRLVDDAAKGRGAAVHTKLRPHDALAAYAESSRRAQVFHTSCTRLCS